MPRLRLRREWPLIVSVLLLATSSLILIAIFTSYQLRVDQTDDEENQYPDQYKKRWRDTSKVKTVISEHYQQAAGKGQRPNIILILADDYGWKDIGYHGSEIRTPHLDKLAAEGVKLDNYYVQASCSPTRASLLTGRYQSHTGIDRVLLQSEVACLPLHMETLPEALQQYGYATHLVGKWHLGMSRWECLPNQRGFNSFLGFHGGSEHYFNHTKQRKARSIDMVMSGHDFWKDEKVTYQYEGKYSTNVYTQRTKQIIRKHATNGKPMFILLSFQATHEPLEVPSHYSAPYKTVIADEKRRELAGVASCMDEAVRNVTLALQRYGLSNNTVVIFSSDNGGALAIHSDNSPLRGHKGLYFEGGIRVVGFVNSPLLSPRVRGTEYRGLMGAADWFPTIVEGVAGGYMRAGVQTDGYNVWDGIRSGSPSPREEYVHSVGGNCDWTLASPGDERWMYGTLRQGPWKLILGKIWQHEYEIPTQFQNQHWAEEGITMDNQKYLFNLEVDPYEKRNLFEQRPDVAERLIARLREHCRNSVTPVPLHEMWEANPQNHGGIFKPWLS